MIDYYEFLQISPDANSDTISRVYRYLARRLHPDNPASGDSDMFRLLKTAWDVLSNPDSRAEYDAARRREAPQAIPLSASIDFMDGFEGELNRRMALLSVLYSRRRSSPNAPEVSLAEIEAQMGFPRDYLDFTTWYLVKKGYVTRADNSDFALTAEGVDYVETQRANLPVLNKLLTDGKDGHAEASVAPRRRSAHFSGPIILPPNGKLWIDRRSGTADRRKGTTAEQSDSNEQRSGVPDRRRNKADRRVNKTDRRSFAPAKT
jgi:curved DNA-binding protein